MGPSRQRQHAPEPGRVCGLSGIELTVAVAFLLLLATNAVPATLRQALSEERELAPDSGTWSNCTRLVVWTRSLASVSAYARPSMSLHHSALFRVRGVLAAGVVAWQRATLTPSRSAGLSVVALVVVGLAFHLPRLFQPFGVDDPNAGVFFGVFLKTWEDFGFFELRGMPLWRQRFFDPAAAEPYLNHPPGIYWTSAMFGSSEAALRLPSIAGAILAAVCLCLLLRPRLGAWPAFGAALCLLGVPSLTLYSQASFETVALGLGLALWLGVERATASAGPPRRRWLALVAVVSFAGPWMDWSFGMFCLGLVPLTATRPLTTWARCLVVPACSALAATASVLLWSAWALRGPRLDPKLADAEQVGFAAMIQETILDRPPWGEFLAGVAHLVPTVAGVAVVVVGVVGLPWLWRRAPRLTLALGVASTHFLVFATHSVKHAHFYCFLTALLTAGCGASAALLARWRRGVAWALIGVVVAATWASSWRVVSRNNTTFFRDLGVVLTEAARPSRFVAHNFWPPFAYYMESPRVYHAPFVDVAALRGLQQREGFGYLWFLDVDNRGAGPKLRPDPELDAFLGPYPRVRVPQLETEVFSSASGIDMRIREVYLVDVPKK